MLVSAIHQWESNVSIDMSPRSWTSFPPLSQPQSIINMIDFINIKTLFLMCCAVLNCSVVSNSLHPHGLQPPRLLCPWGFSRQEYWGGLPRSTSGDLSSPGIEARCPPLQADSTRAAEEYWSGYPIPSQGIWQPGIYLGSLESQADSLPAELPGKPFASPI